MAEFSGYTSFLEVAFGVNLLFGAWDGMYEKLSQLSQQNTAKGGQALELAKADSGDQQTIIRHRERCDRLRTWMRKAGRAAGLVVAITIAISLLVVEPDQAINRWQFSLIAVAGAVVPSLLAIMVIVDYAYTRWINGREYEIVQEALVTQAGEAQKARQIADQVSASESASATGTTATAGPTGAAPTAAPSGAVPTEGVPTEGVPTEGTPTEDAPSGETASTEAAPTETASTEAAPTKAPIGTAPTKATRTETAFAGAPAASERTGAGSDPAGSAR